MKSTAILVSIGLSTVFLLAAAPIASAHCLVNVGGSCTTGHCNVNYGDCSGTCNINVGSCETTYFCTLANVDVNDPHPWADPDVSVHECLRASP